MVLKFVLKYSLPIESRESKELSNTDSPPTAISLAAVQHALGNIGTRFQRTFGSWRVGVRAACAHLLAHLKAV